MDLDDLRRWFAEHERAWAEPERVEAGVLTEHRLTWNYYSRARESGAANVELAAGAVLPGVAMVVGADFLCGLDAKEGHPSRYRRSQRRVELTTGVVVESWVYAVEPAHVRPTHTPPSPAYLRLMLRAAQRHGFSEHYVAELQALLSGSDED
jgi:hypothetical protein